MGYGGITWRACGGGNVKGQSSYGVSEERCLRVIVKMP